MTGRRSWLFFVLLIGAGSCKDEATITDAATKWVITPDAVTLAPGATARLVADYRQNPDPD